MKNNFFGDVWNYLYDAYFNMGSGYENLGTDTTSLITVGTIVFGVYIGAIIACVIIFYNRQVVGSAVRKLLDEKIFDREKALTISDLGYKKNFFVRTLFRDSNALHRVVKCVEEEDFYAEQDAEREEHEKRVASGEKLPKFRDEIYRIDVENDRFYIPEELEITALTKFRKKGSTWLSMVVAIVILTVAFFAVLFFLPGFLGKVDGAFGTISGS